MKLKSSRKQTNAGNKAITEPTGAKTTLLNTAKLAMHHFQSSQRKAEDLKSTIDLCNEERQHSEHEIFIAETSPATQSTVLLLELLSQPLQHKHHVLIHSVHNDSY